jgi:hypothetical protein
MRVATKVVLAAVVASAIGAGAVAAASPARASAAQVCRFSFVHRVTRSTRRHGWYVRFGARIACAKPVRRAELGGSLASWGRAKSCPGCGVGWYVTSAFTHPVYEKISGQRSVTVAGRYFERRRQRHEVWVTFAVQPVGGTLSGFHDRNRRKCQIGSGDFYSCEGFSGVFR